jgi:hypothetical protein
MDGWMGWMISDSPSYEMWRLCAYLSMSSKVVQAKTATHMGMGPPLVSPTVPAWYLERGTLGPPEQGGSVLWKGRDLHTRS